MERFQYARHLIKFNSINIAENVLCYRCCAKCCGRKHSGNQKSLNNFKIYIQIKRVISSNKPKCVLARLKKYRKVIQMEKKLVNTYQISGCINILSLNKIEFFIRKACWFENKIWFQKCTLKIK